MARKRSVVKGNPEVDKETMDIFNLFMNKFNRDETLRNLSGSNISIVKEGWKKLEPELDKFLVIREKQSGVK